MKNYIIAKKGLLMNAHWIYALSVEGRKAFEKGSESKKMDILIALLTNGNITMPKMIEILK